MTSSEKEEHKEKIKKILVDHLTTLGYPDLDREQIIAELKPMWLKLEEAGLVVGDMTFTAFKEQATNAAIMDHMREVIGI